MDPRIRLTRAARHLPADGELEMTQDSAFLFRAGEGSPGGGPGVQPLLLLASPGTGLPRRGPLWGLVRLQGRITGEQR